MFSILVLRSYTHKLNIVLDRIPYILSKKRGLTQTLEIIFVETDNRLNRVYNKCFKSSKFNVTRFVIVILLGI